MPNDMMNVGTQAIFGRGSAIVGIRGSTVPIGYVHVPMPYRLTVAAIPVYHLVAMMIALY